MNSPRLCLLLVTGVLFAGGTARPELRLLARMAGRTIPVSGVENNRIVATDNGRKVPLVHDTVFEIEGDLIADSALVLPSPNYGLSMADTVTHPLPPGVLAVAAVRTRHLTEMDGKKRNSEFRAQWPAETGEGGVMVMAWVVDGKITELAVAKVAATRTAKFFIAGHEFQLRTAAEAGGHPVMLLWEQGRFIPPKPRFEDPRAQRAFETMVLGDIAPLQAALAAGLKPGVKGDTGATLLHFAAEAGVVEAVDLLLTHGAKANAATEHGRTPLHWAATNGRLAVVERLLAAKASVRLKTDDDETALHGAVHGGHQAIARLLVDAGAEMNAATDAHESAYSLAVDRGYADLTTQMVNHGVDPRAYEQRQMERVLITQAAKGNTAMVRFLISQRVNPRAEFEGTSALSAAAVSGDAELVRVLLQGGAGIDDVSADGRTALLTACAVGRIEFVRALLDGGANVNSRAKDGATVLSLAAIRNIPELVELLLARGANPLLRDNDQRAPLDLALQSGARAAARILADHGGTIDLKSARAPELLAAAIKLDLPVVIRAALAAGWSPDSRLTDDWPALSVARACGAGDCATVLEQAGADRSPVGAPVLVSAREIDAPPRLVAGAALVDPRDPDAVFPASLVEMDVVLDSQGRVRFPVVVAGAGWRLDNAALQTVSLWRFTPATRTGKPVAVRLRLPVEFPASTDLAIQPDEADLLPVPLKRVSPVYPAELSRSGQVGRANVVFTVGVDGRTRDARIRVMSHPAFRQPTLEAVAKWIFKPGERDGKPVAVRFEQEMVFSLN